MASKLTVDEIDLGTGGLDSEGNLVLDDGAGDSPQIQLVNGSDETGIIYCTSAGDIQIVVPKLTGAVFIKKFDETQTYLKLAATGLNVYSGDIYVGDDAWIGLGSTKGRIVFDDQTPDEIEIMDANVGIGVSPGAGYHLRVEDTTVDTTVAYAGLRAAHTKTAGASDHDDDLTGADLSVTLNQNGGEVGTTVGVLGTVTITDGSVGDGVNTRSATGGRFAANVGGGTVTSHLTGFYCPAGVSGGTVGGNVFGFYSYVNLTGGTVTGNAYGGIVIVDDQIGAGTVYDLYLWELNGVNYGIYQNGTADNAFGGNILPTGNKAKNLGAAGNRWNTLYQGTSTAAGTSRLIQSTRDCPICKQPMVRGTGSLCVLGEDRDFVLAHCLHCGSVAMEEHQHLPVEALAQRQSPSYIKLVGFEVFEMSGNSRSVRVDFKYTDNEMETVTDPEGKEREMIKKPGITNSTYLSDAELDSFLAMSESERKTYLLQLGQREWDALEDTRLMREECANLQTNLNEEVADLVDKDLRE